MRCLLYFRERNQPLGKGTSLPARLLQLTTSASSPNTRETVAFLLFELSNSSAEEFIENIGYGYASGFLITHNIPVPASFTEGESAASSSESSSRVPVNPITGQRLDKEPVKADPFEGMTQEEKEREAERLFVLFERHGNLPTPLRLFFERGRSVKRLVKRVWANLRPRNRLKKTGVMNVKNPIEQAIEEGRFEELSDEDENDD